MAEYTLHTSTGELATPGTHSLDDALALSEVRACTTDDATEIRPAGCQNEASTLRPVRTLREDQVPLGAVFVTPRGDQTLVGREPSVFAANVRHMRRWTEPTGGRSAVVGGVPVKRGRELSVRVEMGVRSDELAAGDVVWMQGIERWCELAGEDLASLLSYRLWTRVFIDPAFELEQARQS